MPEQSLAHGPHNRGADRGQDTAHGREESNHSLLNGHGSYGPNKTDQETDASSLRLALPKPEAIYERRYSVATRAREFDVINYGPKSLQGFHTSSSSPGLYGLNRFASRPPQLGADRLANREPAVILQESDESLNNNENETVKPPKSVRLVIDSETEDVSEENEVSIFLHRSIKNASSRELLDFVKRGRIFAERKKDRLVDKNGECKIVYSKVSDRGHKFLVDIFTTILELKWRYHLVLFVLAFGLSWLFFALIWLAVVRSNEKLTCNGDCTNDKYTPCVEGVESFSTALLFSIETQHTIGYGTRAITPSCPLAMVLLMFQSMYGVLMQCILTGLIFAKIARPKRRAQTILFSEKAVICQRDGQRSLMFRVGDMRKSQILGATIKVLLAERRVTKEGENLPIVTQELPVTTESGSDFVFLAWPINIMHKINEESPLWNVSAVELLEKDCELIVVLEGVDEITGATFQVRTSYLPSEILWGHHLKSLLSKSTGGVYTIDYTFFHDAIPLNISDVSAKRATTFRRHGTHNTIERVFA